MFRLAHISDLHIGPLPAVPLAALASKRLLGYISWRTRRQREHRPEVLEALRQDLDACRPDHIALTGDLVNIALAAEFEQAGRWLHALGPPERVSVVPGNHDAYVALDQQAAWAPFAGYMTADGADGRPGEIAFPYFRRRGPLALIGLSSAVASGPGFATGRLGETQLGVLDVLLGDLDPSHCCRVVLVHHPPVDGATSQRKRLVDAEALRHVLGERGAEMVLHGHTHRPSTDQIAGPAGPIAVLGAASASQWPGRPGAGACYRIFGIEQDGGGWRITTESRHYRAGAGFEAAPEASVPEAIAAS